MELSHTQKLAQKKGVIFFYFEAVTDEGEEAFYYTSMRLDRLDKFARDLKRDDAKPIDINDYGTIIYSGSGKPSEEEDVWVHSLLGLDKEDTRSVEGLVRGAQEAIEDAQKSK